MIRFPLKHWILSAVPVSGTVLFWTAVAAGSSRLEVASFIGTDASQNPAESAARSLERIADATEKVAGPPEWPPLGWPR
jgi:hypothetical protein